MKQCPNCRKTYPDDLFFCLDHGLPLIPAEGFLDSDAPTDVNPEISYIGQTEKLVVPGPPTEVISHSGPSDPTAVVSRAPGYAVKDRSSPSVLLYVFIGILLTVCFGLIAGLVFSNRDRFLGSTPVQSPTPESTRVFPSPSPAVRSANTQLSPSPTPLNRNAETTKSVAGSWKGEWRTDSGTLFDFELTLSPVDGAGLDGRVKWTMRRTARADKQTKVGLSAFEFVRGRFEQQNGSVTMKGYRKEDPNNVLVMLDEYKLRLSSDGTRLSGLARNGGKWNGKVDLSRAKAGN